MATTGTITDLSSKLTKDSEFYKPSNPKKIDGRRRTAAERLEADKLKYVKSAEARKANVSRDSHSINVDAKKADDKSGSDVCLDRILDESNRKSNRLNRSNTDANINERWRVSSSNRLRSSSTAENASNVVPPSSTFNQTKKDSPKEEDPQTSLSKDSKNTKLSLYLSKAKESLKSVTSTIASSGLGDGNRLRQSRSTETRSSKYRSSSVGANAQRHLDIKVEVSKSPFFQQTAAASPRSQLKNARHKLKKVAHVNQNKTYSPARHHAKTFLVDPQQKSSQIKVNQSGGNLSHHKAQCVKNSKPLAIIDNTVMSARSGHLRKDLSSKIQKTEVSFQKPIVKPVAKNEIRSKKDEVTIIEVNEEDLSTRLEDKKVSPDDNLQMPISKSSFSQVKGFHPQLGSAPPHRKMGGRIGNSSDLKKSTSRVSFHEDASTNNPGFRKSITEVLEDLINHDDDIDTAYNSMSPVASLDCKVQLASLPQASDKASRSSSKTPESSRSRTPTCDDGISFHTTDPELASKEQQESPAESDESKVIVKSSNLANGDDYQLIKHEGQVSRLPQIVSNDAIVTSFNLAPKGRKEVAPDYSLSNKSSLCKDFSDTLKSQNTSSSASADINKPLTALTAADLKPRGEVRNAVSLKSGFDHPALRGIPKRHCSALVFQSQSSNKQLVRMTSSQGSQGSSSSPHSSLKRVPVSTHNSSLKRNRQRSKSDVSLFQNELDHFFSTMGMDESLTSPLSSAQDTLFTTAPFGSESDFAFSTASACVRDSVDDLMEVDPQNTKLANAPSVSIVEKKARVVRWVMSINKSIPAINTSPRSPRRAPPLPVVPPRLQVKTLISETTSLNPPPVPPRTGASIKQSDV